MPKNIIPNMTDPLGKYWEQPDKENILLDDTYALMEKADFDKLCNYEASFPSGVYLGKMWRRNNTLYWWDKSIKGTDYCYSESRRILIA